jgi:hypothetical protein
MKNSPVLPVSALEVPAPRIGKPPARRPAQPVSAARLPVESSEERREAPPRTSGGHPCGGYMMGSGMGGGFMLGSGN